MNKGKLAGKGGKSGLTGLGFLWIAHKSHKNRGSKNVNDHYEKDRYRKSKHQRSIMSGSSPVDHREEFEFKDVHSTPPSTSKKISSSDQLTRGSLLVDATDSTTEFHAFSPINSRNSFQLIDSTLPCIGDKIPLAEEEDAPNISSTSNETQEDSKLSGDDSKQDDGWTNREENQNEEDICLKCLYVSMQCCECCIM